MTVEDDILAYFGADLARYVANKHRGGLSGTRGTRYEDHFAVWVLARAAVALIDDPSSNDPHMASQVSGFVDDLRVSSEASTDYYQLKNAATVSWTSGEHPIAKDFEHQFVLSGHRGEPAPRTHLIVSDPALVEPLSARIPESIRDHTSIADFPWLETANRLVLTYAPLREILARLAHVENPRDDTLAGVFYMLCSAYLETPRGDHVRSILDRARGMFPGQIRTFPISTAWEDALLPAFVAVLAGIQGLEYGAERGFFHWSGYGTQGVFGSDVTSDGFRTFQATVIDSRPSTFEAFEALLP